MDSKNQINMALTKLKIEADIRGKFLTMSCDIELMLLYIMAYSSPNPNQQVRKFKGMMISDKIQNTISDLKKYKRKYYKKYKKELDQLNEFRIIRNDMAHNSLLFPTNNVSKVRFMYVGENILGQDHLEFKEYTVAYLMDRIKKFYELNKVLFKLSQELINDYDKNNVQSEDH